MNNLVGHIRYLVAQLGTRAWWARVLHKVPESTKLGYQSANFQNSQDWYPSLVDSGTSQGTRVHQARVPICQFSK